MALPLGGVDGGGILDLCYGKKGVALGKRPLYRSLGFPPSSRPGFLHDQQNGGNRHEAD